MRRSLPPLDSLSIGGGLRKSGLGCARGEQGFQAQLVVQATLAGIVAGKSEGLGRISQLLGEFLVEFSSSTH